MHKPTDNRKTKPSNLKPTDMQIKKNIALYHQTRTKLNKTIVNQIVQHIEATDTI